MGMPGFEPESIGCSVKAGADRTFPPIVPGYATSPLFIRTINSIFNAIG